MTLGLAPRQADLFGSTAAYCEGLAVALWSGPTVLRLGLDTAIRSHRAADD